MVVVLALVVAACIGAPTEPYFEKSWSMPDFEKAQTEA
jgi:hypothetical protein